jgi:NADH:ubiquinone oxidoreductase subunit F (NADH-binding)
MLYNEPHPLEVKIVTKRFGLANSASLDTYLATDGFKAFFKAMEMTPEQIIEEVKASALRGAGALGFQPALSGVLCRALRPSRNTSLLMPTKASPAPARTVC